MAAASGMSTATRTIGGCGTMPRWASFSNALIAIDAPQSSAGRPTGFQRPPYNAAPALRRSSAYFLLVMRQTLIVRHQWQLHSTLAVQPLLQARYPDNPSGRRDESSD